MLKDILRQITIENRIERQRPKLPSSVAEIQPQPEANPELDLRAEYIRLAKETGFYNPHVDGDLEVEKFKDFLREKDWPVFSLETVKTYMDQLSERDGNGYGWHWRPLREKDNIRDARFGKPSRRLDSRVSEDGAARELKASDYYAGPTQRMTDQWPQDIGGPQMQELPASAKPYDKLVPIHALRKVSEIEKEYRGHVSFFVCDYTTAPHVVDPDPFLMAVINNNRLNEGEGRFVIDVWDEPGFGLEQQLIGGAS